MNDILTAISIGKTADGSHHGRPDWIETWFKTEPSVQFYRYCASD